MSTKTYIPEEGATPDSQIGSAMEALAATIHARRFADEGSYSYRLLMGDIDKLLKKITEESVETALAAKDLQRFDEVCATTSLEPAPADAPEASARDAVIDHLRYEAGDVVYHLLVLLERVGIPLEELAAELNSRMTPEALAERPGAVRLLPQHVNRGK